jgi:pyruvate formate lyase activating enzyme
MPSQIEPWDSVVGFEPMSLCDWPGKVSCVLFLGGCDLRCPTCHNREIAWHPERFPRLGFRDVMARIQGSVRWLDGIVITGGEPTLNQGLHDLTEALSRFELPIKVDTNGMRPEVVEHLLSGHPWVSVSVDFKGPFSLYPGLTGGVVSEALARENLSALFRMSQLFPGRLTFRCTMVPELSPEDIVAMQALLPQKLELTLQQFIPPPHWRSVHASADPQA